MTTTFHRHIAAIQSTGIYTTMHILTGRVDVSHMIRSFSIYFGRKHPGIEDYHFMWFNTATGIVICFAGNLFLQEAVIEYMAKAITLKTVGGAELIYTGRSKKTFMAELTTRLTQYQPIRYGRSYGGTRFK